MAMDDFSGDNLVLPFWVDPLDTRGRAVRLGAVIDTILARHAYPPAVERLIAEAITLTAMMGSALKTQGRFQLQTRSDGPVEMLVVDFSPPSDIRAYARFDEAKVLAETHAAPVSLLGTGHLAFTIEQTQLQTRYQGIVALDGQGLVEAALQYFKQSEQIPTVMRVAVAEMRKPGARHWRAGGVIAQFLPSAPERMKQADLDPGDAPSGIIPHSIIEDDAWVEARSLVETVEDIELVDPELGLDRLLYRLFNERGVTVADPAPLKDQCRCSLERIRETLASFPTAEVNTMRETDGSIGVTCEFCARQYRLSLDLPGAS